MGENEPLVLDELVEKARAIHFKLLSEFGSPEWRAPLPPLDELVSTILSQNTNDANRDRAFQALKSEHQQLCKQHPQ